MKTQNFLFAFLILTLVIAACTSQTAGVAGNPADELIPPTGGGLQSAPDAQAAQPDANDAVAISSDESSHPSSPAQIVYQMPTEAPKPIRTLQDADSSIRAYEKRAVSGDNYLNNLYERPFTSQDMLYQPDIDIQTVDMAEDDQFYYFTIRLEGMNPDEWGLNGIYAIEMDTNFDGRGDLVITTDAPDGPQWSVEHVRVMEDSNGDVGGPQPLIPDTGFSGSGFDLQVDLQADRAAFSRIDPDDSSAIQIALHRSLIGEQDGFLWNAWADNGLRDLSRFYYNDAFPLRDAGSPIRGDDYPLKEIFNLDNTCRLPYGQVENAGSVPGVCKSAPPEPAKDKPKEIVCEPPYYWVNGKCQYFG